MTDAFGIKAELKVGAGRYAYYSLKALERRYGSFSRLPFSIRILLESAARLCDDYIITKDDVANLAGWMPQPKDVEIPFMPVRVLMQDLTGVPAVNDLAAMRHAIKQLGGDPQKINPLVPVDLVVDHSLQVDAYGSNRAPVINTEREFKRNHERYIFLKWAASSLKNFRVIPPESGICHQVNLEYLSQVVWNKEGVLFPDTLVGLDSHTPMVNALGVMGWGVGGIEAEAVMLGQVMRFKLPQVVGFKLTGRLKEGVTATDLVLTVTETLRKKGVVDRFVEFFGNGLAHLSVPDRATIANMAPECGSTVNLFPVDQTVIEYLKLTGKPEQQVQAVEQYLRAQGLFWEDGMQQPEYSETIELDLASVEPSIAGPMRPHDRVPLSKVKQTFEQLLAVAPEQRGFGLKPEELHKSASLQLNGHTDTLKHGAIVIAAITSCTNTSNPSVMIGAGLLAKKAVEKGLKPKAYIKTSMAPGSKVVTSYLEKAQLLPYLDALGFNVVGYGCTTCIGNSGPLAEPVTKAIKDGNLVVSSVLSGNRNFSGRVHSDTKANWLMSPPLVVAYSLAGTIDIDLFHEPLGQGRDGPVYLKDIWPAQAEVDAAVHAFVSEQMFRDKYGKITTGPEKWRSLQAASGELFPFDASSTDLKLATFFDGMPKQAPGIFAITGARCLAIFGDSVTTDHISPAGAVPKNSAAARWLVEHGVEPKDFNQLGAYRGNHEVMMRATFSNPRIRNLMVPGSEGSVTLHHPSGEKLEIYDAAMKYRAEKKPLIVLAGKEYGTGSSRDWAAKGTFMLGIRAVIAQSFERIHRSNLIGMGVLPLQFKDGEGAQALGLNGDEEFDIEIPNDLKPRQELNVVARGKDGAKQFKVTLRVDTPLELDYCKHGGILQYVLRKMLAA